MTGDDRALQLVYAIGVLILVGSAFAVRRVPLRQSVKMALAWVLIFAAMFAVFALRDDFRALGSRLMAAVTGQPVAAAGGALRIPAESDGHYWVSGEINGHAARFLIDSGASVTTIDSETARSAGIEPSGGFGAMVDTANGTVLVQRAEAASLRVGTIERRDLAIHISGHDSINVIGMNFLSTLSSWGVEDGALVLRP
jgi:aspartyl protease family protein